MQEVPHLSHGTMMLWFLVGDVALIAGTMVIAALLLVVANRKLAAEQHAIEQLRHQGMPDDMETALSRLSGRRLTVAEQAVLDVLQNGEFREESLPYEEWIDWPRYLAGIFVFIGLLGTVLGIAVAVQSLAPILDSTSSYQASGAEGFEGQFDPKAWQALLNGVQRLLAGVATVAWCTLAGLVATLVIASLNSAYLVRSRQLVHEIEALADDHYLALWTEEEEGREGSVLKTLAEASRRLARAVEPASKLFSDAATSLAESVGTVEEQTTVAAAAVQALSALVASAHDALGARVQEVREATVELHSEHAEVAATAARLNEVSESVGRSAAEMTTAVRQLRADLREDSEEQDGRLGAMLEQVTGAQTMLQSLLRRFETTLMDLPMVADGSALRQHMDRLAKQLERSERSHASASPTGIPGVGSEGAQGADDAGAVRPEGAEPVYSGALSKSPPYGEQPRGTDSWWTKEHESRPASAGPRSDDAGHIRYASGIPGRHRQRPLLDRLRHWLASRIGRGTR